MTAGPKAGNRSREWLPGGEMNRKKIEQGISTGEVM